jgi:hypothetical protein
MRVVTWCDSTLLKASYVHVRKSQRRSRWVTLTVHGSRVPLLGYDTGTVSSRQDPDIAGIRVIPRHDADICTGRKALTSNAWP